MFKRKTKEEKVVEASERLDESFKKGSEYLKNRRVENNEKATKNKFNHDGSFKKYVQIELDHFHDLNEIMEYYPEYEVLTITSYAFDMYVGLKQTLYLKLK